VTTARREALLRGIDLKSALVQQVGASLREGDFDTRLRIALRLEKSGMTRRAIYETTGVARDTLRKYLEGRSQKSNEA
jgi:predicted transcriptional regulator